VPSFGPRLRCERCGHLGAADPGSPTSAPMPHDGAIIFGDLIGKLDVLHVACGKCGRKATCQMP
jgi:hypothetical protein